MKESVNNILKHEVELAGRSVSVLLLLGVFLAGSGGAALLTTFGTVSGSANVDQAFTVDSQTGQDAEVVESVSVTGGESVVTNHDFRNRLNRSIEVNVTSKAPEELSIHYRFVDDLVATTEYNEFNEEDANLTGDMNSEFAYNPVDDKVGVHAYGQTVYNEGSRGGDAESYAGFNAVIDQEVRFSDNTVLKINYSEGDSALQNMTSPFPYWIRLTVDAGVDDIDSNGEIGEKWVVLEKTVNAGSGARISPGDSSFGDDAIVYKESDRSITARFSDVVGSTSRQSGPAHYLEQVDVLTGSGSDDSTYVDVWFYGLNVNPDARGTPVFLKDQSGNFTRTFKPGVTQGAVIAEAPINAYGSGISYTADFNPLVG